MINIKGLVRVRKGLSVNHTNLVAMNPKWIPKAYLMRALRVSIRGKYGPLMDFKAGRNGALRATSQGNWMKESENSSMLFVIRSFYIFRQKKITFP